jgi:hypothetical protein
VDLRLAGDRIHVHLAPRQNLRTARSGLARTVKKGINLGVVTIGWGLVNIGCLIWVAYEQRIIVQLRQQGIAAKGKVIELKTEPSLVRRLNFKVWYQFRTVKGDLPGESITASQIIGADHYKRLKVGDEVTIHYLPGKPLVSRLTGPDTDHTRRDIALLSALLFIAILALWLSGILPF